MKTKLKDILLIILFLTVSAGEGESSIKNWLDRVHDSFFSIWRFGFSVLFRLPMYKKLKSAEKIQSVIDCKG